MCLFLADPNPRKHGLVMKFCLKTDTIFDIFRFYILHLEWNQVQPSSPYGSVMGLVVAIWLPVPVPMKNIQKMLIFSANCCVNQRKCCNLKYCSFEERNCNLKEKHSVFKQIIEISEKSLEFQRNHWNFKEIIGISKKSMEFKRKD